MSKLRKSRVSHKMNEKFFRTWTPNMAYVLGFAYADGNINTTLHHNKLVFQQNIRDLPAIDFVRDLIYPEKRIYFYKRKNCEICVLDLSSKILVNDIKELGCVERKTYEDLSFPPNIPEQYKIDFVRGVLIVTGKQISQFFRL